MPVVGESLNRIVLHADDFGMNEAVNRGILASFREGLLTSTSLLANAPAADAACAQWPSLITEQSSSSLKSSAARHELGDPQLPFDLGIHLNLTQGQPLTGARYPAELLDEHGNFPGIGAAFYRLNRSRSDRLYLVETELRAQIEWMCERRVKPSHLNGHQYVELIPQIASMIPGMLQRYGIPVVRMAREPDLARNVLFRGRVATWGVGIVKRYYATEFRRRIQAPPIGHPDQFFGTCHAGKVTLRTMSDFLRHANQSRCTEIGLHPGDDPASNDATVNAAWFDPLNRLRKSEKDWLCHPDLSKVLLSRNLSLGRLQLVGK